MHILRLFKKNETVMAQLTAPLSTFRKRNYSHPLYDKKQIKKNVPILDVKTGFTMTKVDHPMPILGAGVTRGYGIRVEDDIPRNVIFAISKDPMTLMDLELYTKQDYVDNGWVIFGTSYACKNNDFTMLANTRAPINGEEVEKSNAKLFNGSLPETFKSVSGLLLPGNYVYLRSTCPILKGSMVVLDNYGKGRYCLRWEQDPTVKRQQQNMILYAKNMKKRKIGENVCVNCSVMLPFKKTNKTLHNIKCKENKVNGNVFKH